MRGRHSRGDGVGSGVAQPDRVRALAGVPGRWVRLARFGAGAGKRVGENDTHLVDRDERKRRIQVARWIPTDPATFVCVAPGYRLAYIHSRFECQLFGWQYRNLILVVGPSPAELGASLACGARSSDL